MPKKETSRFKPGPALEKYFWDHTQGASDLFKMRRLLEYASFPDLLQIPYDFLKINIQGIDAEKLRTSQTRRRFVREIQNHILSSSNWDEILMKIAGTR